MCSMQQFDFIPQAISGAYFLSSEVAHRVWRYVGHEYGSELPMILVAKIVQRSRNDYRVCICCQMCTDHHLSPC